MRKKYNVTTILILAGFFLSAFLMVRAFTCIKAGELSHFLISHYYGDGRDTKEELDYSKLYLEEKYHVFSFASEYLKYADFFKGFPTAEKISELMPKIQREMFLTYHDGEYLYYGRYYLLSDEEEVVADIGLTSWNNVTRANKVRDCIIFTLVLFVMIGIFKYRKKLWKDKESEEGMAITLTKGLACEMAEPLHGLRTAVEEWKNADETEKNTHSGKVIAEVDRMDEVIKNLLKLRDFEAGNIDLHLEEVNLSHLTNAVLKRLDPFLAKKVLTAHIDSQAPEDCVVKADPQILKLVIGNLIMRTAEYSSRKVEIMLIAGKTVQFQALSDDYQISKEATSSIWKDYSLYDDCMTDKFGSNGVGLAAAGRMLDAHKAKYGCLPAERGTMFWFEMKRIRNHE